MSIRRKPIYEETIDKIYRHFGDQPFSAKEAKDALSNPIKSGMFVWARNEGVIRQENGRSRYSSGSRANCSRWVFTGEFKHIMERRKRVI